MISKNTIRISVLAAACAVATAAMAVDNEPKTMGQMAKTADAKVQEMDGMLSTAFKLRADAEKNKDVGALSTLGDAIETLKGLLKLAEDSLQNLRDAQARGDTEGVRHHYELVAIQWSSAREVYNNVQFASGTGVEPGTGVSTTFENNNVFPLPTADELTYEFQSVDQLSPISDPPVNRTPYF